MAEKKIHKLAVLIDADNASSSKVHDLFAEISRHGIATVRRAYGDWTTDNLKGWKSELHAAAIQPIQQFRYTTGKNSTDSALIIDAMDLLHAGHLDGFCLVSSDSDFTRLATRIRESGLVVYGFGQKKTPQAFVKACDIFKFTEILGKEPSPKKNNEAKKEKAPEQKKGEPSLPPLGTNDRDELEGWFEQALTDVDTEDGWAPLSRVKALIQQYNPAFDYRNYNRPDARFRNFTALCEKIRCIESEKRADAAGQHHHVFVRLVTPAPKA